jgi:hypothetical protein
VQTLASYGGDVSYILNHLQYDCEAPCLPGTKDRTRLDVFSCLGELLDTPRGSIGISLSETDRVWEAGGGKVDAAVFNMYPWKVSHVQPGTDLATNTLPMLVGGLDEMSDIAEAFSWVDATSGPYVEACLSTFLRGTVSTTCTRARRKHSKRRVDLDSRMYNASAPSLAGCLIDQGQRERLWYISLMRTTEVDRKMHSDRRAPLTSAYELCNAIGWYTPAPGVAPLDSLATGGEPSPARRGRAPRYRTPRMRAIEAFSHTFSVGAG